MSYPSSDTATAYAVCVLMHVEVMRQYAMRRYSPEREIISLNFAETSCPIRTLRICNIPWHLFIIMRCSCLNTSFVCHTYTNVPL